MGYAAQEPFTPVLGVVFETRWYLVCPAAFSGWFLDIPYKMAPVQYGGAIGCAAQARFIAVTGCDMPRHCFPDVLHQPLVGFGAPLELPCIWCCSAVRRTSVAGLRYVMTDLGETLMDDEVHV